MSEIKNLYTENGYVISNPILNDESISWFREKFDEEFQHYENNTILKLTNLKNEDLIKRIVKIFNSHEIKQTISELEKITDEKVSLLPTFEIFKNYHVNLNQFLGWHRDCGGELKYDYCRKILYGKDYIFSKVGIYFQDNTEYGGCIDLIKKSQKNFSNKKKRNIKLFFLKIFHKYFRKIYTSLSEKLFMKILDAERLYPKKSAAVFFDSRTIHRGSPISKSKMNEVKFLDGKYKAFLPKEKDKYTIYCHFGSAKSVDSYMYDRLRRENNSKELELWLKQIEFISKYDQKLSNQMKLVIDPITQKYKEFLN